MKIGEIELLDREANFVKGLPFFKNTGDSRVYAYDDAYAEKVLAVYGFTEVQREVYVWYFQVFNLQEVYLSKSERFRRVALAMYSDRTQFRNIKNMVKVIRKKLAKIDDIVEE